MAKESDPSKNLCFLFFQRNFLEERRISSLLPDSFIHFFRTTISRIGIVFSIVHSIVFPLSLSPCSTTINYDSGCRTGGLYHPWIRLLLEVRKGLEGGREKENREERRVAKINRQIERQTVERTDKCIGARARASRGRRRENGRGRSRKQVRSIPTVIGRIDLLRCRVLFQILACLLMNFWPQHSALRATKGTKRCSHFLDWKNFSSFEYGNSKSRKGIQRNVIA